MEDYLIFLMQHLFGIVCETYFAESVLRECLFCIYQENSTRCRPRKAYNLLSSADSFNANNWFHCSIHFFFHMA